MIGERYAEARAIPAENIVRIDLQPNDEVSRVVYERQIETPIAIAIERAAAHDRILYIVLTKGVPLRITGSAGRTGTYASVDSELTLLYRKMTGIEVGVTGPVENPYFLGDKPITDARFFTHREQDVFLVSRLDGFSVDDVFALIDRGAKPSREGSIALDMDAGGVRLAADWLTAAADRLKAAGQGDRVVTITPATAGTPPTVSADNVLGYYSLASSNPASRKRHLGVTFRPGARAVMPASTDARTFVEPPSDWTPGSAADRKRFFAGSSEPLAGDLVHDGVTGLAASVAEPYLDAAIRPNILFPAYVAGFNLVEAFYLAMPYLSWQSVVVGDPLCAPFRGEPLAQAQISEAVDPPTGLPRFLAAWRLRNLARASRGVKPEALVLVLRAESMSAKSDQSGAREALEQAVRADGQFVLARLRLGTIYEKDAEYDKAIEQYRYVLASAPNSIPALNNLALDLAVHKQAYAEALPLARKAYQLAPYGIVVDTLGWILHLSGETAEALKLLNEAAAADPVNGEIRLHRAVAYSAAGQTALARSDLAAALALAPSLRDRPDVTELQVLLARRPHD